MILQRFQAPTTLLRFEPKPSRITSTCGGPSTFEDEAMANEEEAMIDVGWREVRTGMS